MHFSPSVRPCAIREGLHTALFDCGEDSLSGWQMVLLYLYSHVIKGKKEIGEHTYKQYTHTHTPHTHIYTIHTHTPHTHIHKHTPHTDIHKHTPYTHIQNTHTYTQTKSRVNCVLAIFQSKVPLVKHSCPQCSLRASTEQLRCLSSSFLMRFFSNNFTFIHCQLTTNISHRYASSKKYTW